MSAEMSRLQSPAAIQIALDEFVQMGRAPCLARYDFAKSRDYMVRDAKTGQLCDSKAIVGAAFGHQFPAEGPLKSADFSGGEATLLGIGCGANLLGSLLPGHNLSAMAFLTFDPGLKLSKAPHFGARYRAGQFAPVTGLYQCVGCGFETVCLASKPLQSREDRRAPRHPRECPGVSWRLLAQANERPWRLLEQQP